jgi:hypothetical protein
LNGKNKEQVARLKLTDTFLLCGGTAKKTHIKKLVMLFHPMSLISVIGQGNHDIQMHPSGKGRDM